MTRRTPSELASGAIRRWPSALNAFGAALRDFLHGFVGPTAIAREPGAAQRALESQASGRDRCC
ncbi:MAG: hypothetical protein R3F21_17070 [Myxococcota bacterium]